jgi:hypothetical protein
MEDKSSPGAPHFVRCTIFRRATGGFNGPTHSTC